MKYTKLGLLVSAVASVILVSGCSSDSDDAVFTTSYGLPVTSSGVA